MPRVHHRQPTGAVFLIAAMAAVAAGFAQEVDPSRGTHQLSQVDQLLTQATKSFARRAGEVDGPIRLDRAALGRSVEWLEEALVRAPERLDVRAVLLRVLLFEGEYVATTDLEKKAVFERGRQLFDDGRRLLREATGERDLTRVPPRRLRQLLAEEPAAGSFFFWGAVHYGLWAEYYGSLAAVRKGLAKGLWRMGSAALALDPEIDSRGPSRFLGRLHHLTPRIPLITGWADRRLALELLAEAWRTAPEEPLNGIFYAQALEELANDDRAARQVLEGVLERPPRLDRRYEDSLALERARELLARLDG